MAGRPFVQIGLQRTRVRIIMKPMEHAPSRSMTATAPAWAAQTASESGGVTWPAGLARTGARLAWYGRLAALPSRLSLIDLARKFGVSKSTAHKWAHLFGYALFDPRRRAGPRGCWDSVDWTHRDSHIARELGVSRERVRQVRRSRGLPPSAPGAKSVRVAPRQGAGNLRRAG
jgi:hypothetical protein